MIYHWTKRVDANNKNFFVSNKLSDKSKYIKAKRHYETRNKTVEMRLYEIGFLMLQRQENTPQIFVWLY